MVRGHRRAGFLRYAAIQFVLLLAVAMVTYPGGTWLDPSTPRYLLTRNFISDLGATHAFGGEPNHVSQALFSIAMVTLGGALVAFAWTWRAFAYRLGKARAAGIASALLGTASGLAFAAIPAAPVDLDFRIHNDIVIAAFGALLGYVLSLTILMGRNRVGRFAANAVYLTLVLSYFILVLFAFRVHSEAGFELQVISQKAIAGASMVYIAYLTTMVRRG